MKYLPGVLLSIGIYMIAVGILLGTSNGGIGVPGGHNHILCFILLGWTAFSAGLMVVWYINIHHEKGN